MRLSRSIIESPLASIAAADASGVGNTPLLGSLGVNSPNKHGAQAVGQAVAIHNALSNFQEGRGSFQIPS